MNKTSLIALFLLSLIPGLLPAQQTAWQPLGPFGGPVSGLTADTSKAGVLYATAGAAGVFKSTDRGGTWRNVLLADARGAVAVDPTRPATLYAIAYPGVVWKSLDAGAHWTQSSQGLSPVQASFTVTVDPARPSRVYLGAGNGVWRSLNGGASWQQANNGLPAGIPQSQVGKLVAVRRPEGTAFAGLADGLYRTTNGAGSWKRLAQGLPAARVTALLASPADPKTLYVLFEGGGGFFKTTNGGESWQPAVKPPAGAEITTTLAIDARSAKTLYAGLSGGRILRSVDGARRWSVIGRTPAQFPSSLTPDPFAARVLYTGLDTLQAGVFRSDDGGATWQRRNQGYNAIGFGGLGVVPDHPEQLWIAGFGDTFRSGNGGRRWIPASFPAGIPYLPDSGGGFAVASATTAYASTLQVRPTVVFLSKTEDGGASWEEVRSFLGRPFPLTGTVQLRLAPSAPLTLYGLEVPNSLPRTPLTLNRTTDGGVSWESLPTDAYLDCGAGDLAVAPSTASVLYAGGAASTPPGTCSTPSARVVRSQDGGTTWTDVSTGLPAGFVARLTVDPVEPGTLYAGLGVGETSSIRGDGVWKSTDGGATWNRAGTELSGKTVTALLATSTLGQVYAALDDHRVFRSDDGGESWDDVSAGLAAEQIRVLAADPANPNRVYAATSQGIWVLTE